ncbi:Smr/MutS family protein [bacterium]|nr:Smr/MutS family protein [bacterium]
MLSQQTRDILEYDRLLALVAGYAVSQDGAAHVRALAPLDDPEAIGRHYDCLDEMRSITGEGHNFRPSAAPVLAGPLARLTKAGVILEGAEIVAVGRMLEAAGDERGYILRREDSLPRLSALAGALDSQEEIRREIERTFDENAEVVSNASPLLSKLRQDARHVRERIEKQLEQISGRLTEAGSTGDNFVTLRQERYVLAVRRDEMHSCPGIIQGESGSGATLFIEPEQVVYSNNRLREIELDIQREKLRILAALSARLCTCRPQLADNVRVLAELDSLYARAVFAREYGCTRPGLTRGGAFVLRRARHPLLLERHLKEADSPAAAAAAAEAVVPLDIELAAGERTLLVSGPNAGGKTVLLKTAGIVVLTAQSGIFPPLGEGSSLPVFAGVFAAIGDEQSLDRDLSTFSSHVLDLVTAIDSGNPDSLILLDEIGVGTDPAEGAALAASVLEHLTRRGCLTLSTTHFGELKLLYERIPGLVNGSLEFDPERMQPTFHFRKGLPGQSYGLAIARNMGMSPLVLERAATYLTGGAININEYLARLEAQQKKLEAATVEAESLQARLQIESEALRRERQESRERLVELARRERDFQKEMARREREHMLQARRSVEEVIARLESQWREGQAEQAARVARRSMEERIAELRAAAEADTGAGQSGLGEEGEPGGAFEAGDRVRVVGLGLEGEIAEGPDNTGRYTVIAGRAKMSLRADEMLRSSNRAARKRHTAGAGFSAPEPEADSAEPGRLDLRGLRVDEIDQELDRFLARARGAGLGSVVIVHGKGTGALRSRVNELLSRDRRVAAFRLGAWNEGGSGATVATFVAE